MIYSIKKVYVALVLAVFLAFMLVQMPPTYSAEVTNPEKALTFLTDVVKLDMTEYNVTRVSNFVEYPTDLGGIAQEEVTYTLESNGSKLDASFRFRNNFLSWCKLYILEGSPLYAQQSTNVLDAAKGLLDRYQAYMGGASYLQTMHNMLDTITETKTMTTTSGNVKLTISNGAYAYTEWMYTSNGIDFDRKRIHFSFENGAFRSFRDDWDLYKIGSDSLDVPKEEAISIARDYAKTVTWKLYMENGTWVEVKDALVDEHVEAELLIGTSREPLTLYPYWRIQLYFDWIYQGNVYGITVALWADTGEILYYEPMAFLGDPPIPEFPSWTPLLFSFIALAGALAFYKRRLRKPQQSRPPSL